MKFPCRHVARDTEKINPHWGDNFVIGDEARVKNRHSFQQSELTAKIITSINFISPKRPIQCMLSMSSF